MIYICKCGKSFSKSGNAATTGFRETENCFGCPYLLPYGENYFDDVQRAFVLDIKGYECRASQFLRYQTELSGALDDKTTIHIESLDFDFLERVGNWVKEHYPDGELLGRFSRESIRSAGYTSDGRYRHTLLCSQNKKGIAAKRALWAEFFDEAYHRTDMSVEEEKEKVLKDIQLGIERAKEAAVTTAESAVKLLAGAEETSTTSESAEDASTFTNLSEQATPESGALANEDENAETCCCSRCQKSDCVCAGTCDAQSRAACDGRQNCSASDSTMEATVAGDCVPMENVDGVTAVSSSDGKGIDVPTGFDYSGIEESTAAVLYNAQSIIINARKECIIKIADAVSMAHDKLVANCDNSKHSHRGENTFRAWCTSVGIGKDAAYRLLQVSTLLKNSTESELQVLEQASPSLLYAAAKPSAPAELVQAVKDGEITTHKQYKELEAQLKETQERAERAEQEAKEAKEKAHRLETRELYDANQRIKELENRPIEVATQAPTEEQINEAAKPVIQEMTAMYKVQLEQQREQIKELEGLATGAYNTLANTCLTISENLAGVFLSDFEKLQAMAQDLSEDTYISVMEPIFEACREICSALEGTDDGEG